MTFSAGVNNNKVSLQNNDLQRIIDTHCLGCIFAKGELKQDKDKLQFLQYRNGCQLGVLNKLQKMGQELEDGIDETGSEFQVIRGRICPFNRTVNWNGWNEKDMALAMSRVRQEATLRPDVVIYFDNSMILNDILETAKVLSKGKIKPQKLHIVNNSKTKPSQIMKFFDIYPCPIPWRVETMMGENTTVERAMDKITEKCTNIFVSYFKAGYKPPIDFFVPIDMALHDKLDRFVILEPIEGDNINGMTVLRTFHKQVGGNARHNIIDKAKKISEEQKCQYLVRPVAEIVTQLSQ